jgi:hypothetical protein
VDWPDLRLERVPPSAFRPPHCPRRGCPQHHIDSPRRFRYTGAGSWTRKSDRRCFPRFRCLSCRSRFIQSAFTTSYWLKRPELLVPIAAGLNAGSAHRQIARSLGCAPSTVTRLAARLGRHALLLQALALEQLPAIDEPIVLDHFETFVERQEQALGLATTVGQNTWFVYGIDPAPHRRGGKRSPAQKTRLTSKPVMAHRGSVRRSTERVLDLLLSKVPESRRLRLVSDGHPAYLRAVKAHSQRSRIEHWIYPNPPRGPKGSEPSPEARVRDRQMRAADALHSLTRHTCAHHHRETIAFGRRTNALVERGFLMVIWRNFVKKVTERRPDRTTTAMEIGLTDSQWDWERVLARRLFPDRLRLPGGWDKVYRREWITSSIGPNTLHRPRHAF